MSEKKGRISGEREHMVISSREKVMVTIAAVCVAGLLVYQFALKSMMERTATLKRVIPEKQQELFQVRRMAEEHSRLRRDIEQLSREVPEPDTGFSPAAFLENALEGAGIREWSFSSPREVRGDHITRIAIDVNIQATGWRELIRFFQLIDEAEPALRLSAVDIRRQAVSPRRGTTTPRTPAMLRADVTVSGLRRRD